MAALWVVPHRSGLLFHHLRHLQHRQFGSLSFRSNHLDDPAVVLQEKNPPRTCPPHGILQQEQMAGQTDEKMYCEPEAAERNKPLFSPCVAGKLDLAHRIVLAPMTRIRADPETMAPTALNAEYYAQRAGPGTLITSEAITVSPEATPVWDIYARVRERGDCPPGIWAEEQTAKWKDVVDAVHARGGLITAQLNHAGRIAQKQIGNHPLVKNHPEKNYSLPPVSSAAYKIPVSDEDGNHYNWDQPQTTPRALSTTDVQRLIQDFATAAANAKAAGFDNVEIHAGHGYLFDQFFCDGVNNQRTDQYGGSLQNRCRILYETVVAVMDVMGEGRVAVRLAPTTKETTGMFYGCRDSDPEKLYPFLIDGLNRFKLSYLLLTEPRVGGLGHAATDKAVGYDLPLQQSNIYRKVFHGTLAGAGAFSPASGADAVKNGAYDLIFFGRWFLANPDLVERLRIGAALNIYDRKTFYCGSTEGYTDYPRMDDDVNQDKYNLMKQSVIGSSLANAKAGGVIIRRHGHANCASEEKVVK